MIEHWFIEYYHFNHKNLREKYRLDNWNLIKRGMVAVGAP
ncbi:hypothetical protein LCGC14_1002540 [marine sediment metagenome]|uniref:Uncharacterized protein n=1 Tax=marine sediment metagenome TaxID=412755 RepID=A0A0F9QL36_9ZZZZ